MHMEFVDSQMVEPDDETESQWQGVLELIEEQHCSTLCPCSTVQSQLTLCGPEPWMRKLPSGG